MEENLKIQLKPKKKLTAFDAISSTLAQMAPAAAIYYGFPVIFAASGIGSPLTLLLATVAITMVGLSLTNFSKIHPSSGSLIKYISMTFGDIVGTTASLVFLIGTIFLAGSAFIELGGWTSDSLALYNIHIHWIVPTIILGLIVWAITVVGIYSSTKIAAVALFIEVAVLVFVSVLVLLHPPAPLSLKPFAFSSIQNGIAGLSLAFPLAIYLFIGFENSAALAEETDNPKRNTARAVLVSIAIMSVFYIFVNYSIIQGFSNHIDDLVKSTNPFIDLSNQYLGSFSVLAIIAGFTSILGMTIACLNGFSRIAFNSAREGLIYRKLSRVSKWGTPIGTLTLLFILGMLAAILIGLLSKGWVTAFGYLSTIGTIPLLLIYSLLNLAVIFYKKEKWPFHKKYLFPSLGLLSILIPIWAMVQPGQPEPVSYFPWIVLALCVVSFIYSWFTVKKKSPISANFRPLLKKEEL
ncbi:MAG: amino acid permease [Bacillaceae bacterium]|uniref:Amino acid permease n=1 Tax=Aeribacillus pallidus TaxID=33936 RepID=A0A165Z3U1_9BACI|nr:MULTISPECIES: APC family permease [Aeribacillus]REJ15535.1 MAG: amino acid permease [Bacillaceae bacterium]KZN97802.1 hypothetical protein AZI98_01260 [Aeribacillus pallidus]MED0714944.1 APC family permease [Aeribacillus composti]MED0745059.1 APC family permease [Aeribacillus composti]REJ26070.1 MAG: amino acid permease [Bacillaceae bacterium]